MYKKCPICGREYPYNKVFVCKDELWVCSLECARTHNTSLENKGENKKVVQYLRIGETASEPPRKRGDIDDG